MWTALRPDIKMSGNVNAFKKILQVSLLENSIFFYIKGVFNTEIYVEFVLHMIYFMLL